MGITMPITSRVPQRCVPLQQGSSPSCPSSQAWQRRLSRMPLSSRLPHRDTSQRSSRSPQQYTSRRSFAAAATCYYVLSTWGMLPHSLCATSVCALILPPNTWTHWHACAPCRYLIQNHTGMTIWYWRPAPDGSSKAVDARVLMPTGRSEELKVCLSFGGTDKGVELVHAQMCACAPQECALQMCATRMCAHVRFCATRSALQMCATRMCAADVRHKNVRCRCVLVCHKDADVCLCATRVQMCACVPHRCRCVLVRHKDAGFWGGGNSSSGAPLCHVES